MIIATCLILTASISYSQQLITGNILDDSGKQIAFASVIEPETSFGTTTNKKGEFTLNIKKLPTKVTISSLNHIQKTIVVNSTENITVILQNRKKKKSSKE